MFVLVDAEYLGVGCGDTWNSGIESVRLMNFPAGPCDLEAKVLGRKFTTQVVVSQTAKVECRVSGDELTCRVY